MKLYLELIEQTDVEINPLIIKVEVENKEQAISLLPNYEMEFEGKNYIKRLHYCYHDENKICETELL